MCGLLKIPLLFAQAPLPGDFAAALTAKYTEDPVNPSFGYFINTASDSLVENLAKAVTAEKERKAAAATAEKERKAALKLEHTKVWRGMHAGLQWLKVYPGDYDGAAAYGEKLYEPSGESEGVHAARQVWFSTPSVSLMLTLSSSGRD